MHILTKEDGTTEEVRLERWGWAVSYFATPDQIKDAVMEQEHRNRSLVIEKNQALARARKTGATKETLKTIADEFEAKMEEIVAPEQHELHQFDHNGIFHRFVEIDWSRVEHFIMYPLLVPKDQIGPAMISIEVKPNMQVFHVYKRFKLDCRGDQGRPVTVYCFGWKDKNSGSTVYNYILPDDKVITSSEDINLSKYGI